MGNILWGIKLGIEILRAKIFRKFVPFHVQFSVTDRCNLRCSYCYASYPERGYEDLATRDIIGIINELSELGTKRINLVGGEPLIREDIGKIIDYIKNKKIECAMTTNGYLVAKKINDVKKLDLLCISLDGDMEANDRNRGGGSYEAAIEAIKIAKEHKVLLQVATVITKNNLHSIEYILKEGKKYGFMVGFTTLINKTEGNNKIVPESIPADEEYRWALQHIIELKKRGYPVLFSIKSLEYSKKWPYSYKEDKVMGKNPEFQYIKCNAGRYFAIIDTNADIYPCPSLVGVIKPLNCLEVGVKRAFSYLNNHNCMTCHIPCQNEFNLMFSLSPSVLLNVLMNYKHSVR